MLFLVRDIIDRDRLQNTVVLVFHTDTYCVLEELFGINNLDREAIAYLVMNLYKKRCVFRKEYFIYILMFLLSNVLYIAIGFFFVINIF